MSAYISGTRARIGQRFSPLDRPGPEVSKNVVKKISRPNPPGRDLRKFESVYLRIAGSTRSAVDQNERRRTLAIEWYSQLTKRCPRSRDLSSQNCSKIARSRLPRPCLSAYISGMRARIGPRFSPLDRAGSDVFKNVVKKISRHNPPGRDVRKFECVYLGIAG